MPINGSRAWSLRLTGCLLTLAAPGLLLTGCSNDDEGDLPTTHQLARGLGDGMLGAAMGADLADCVAGELLDSVLPKRSLRVLAELDHDHRLSDEEADTVEEAIAAATETCGPVLPDLDAPDLDAPDTDPGWAPGLTE